MEACINELVSALESLHSEIKAVKECDKELLKPIVETLNMIDPINRSSKDQLVIKLVNLAREVIKVRLEAIESGNDTLSKLTVPPYDLFLPFKSFDAPEIVEDPPIAVINRLIEDIRYTANVKIENKKESELN